MTTATKTLALLLTGSLAATTGAHAADETISVKKSTLVNLVDLLVQRGVINQDEGKGLVSAAEQEAAAQAAQAAANAAVAGTGKAASGDQTTANLPAGEGAVAAEWAGEPANAKAKTGKIKHVVYVPEFVKKEIRDQVRAELKADVLQDVKQDAKTEGWGIPGALPAWVAAIHPSFDMRIRFADEFYGKENAGGIENVGIDTAGNFFGPYNWLSINRAGNTPQGGLNRQVALNPNEAIVNNQKDRLRLRERFRLGFEANIADGLKAGIRFATSNLNNPVSNDQTLGNTGQSYQFAIDRSYLQYDYIDDKNTNWFSLYAGRIINPFVSTDIVYDPDLSFEGVAGSFRLPFNRGSNKLAGYKAPNPTARFGINQGQQTPDSLFLTLGVFPLQDIDVSVNDKWLYAGQVGADWLVFNDSRFNVAASYYEFQNVNARRNPLGSHVYDWTAPQFVQKGNSMVAITDVNTLNGVCDDTVGCLFGLASEFKVFNATAMFDYAGFDPAHVLLTVDYAKNLGYDKQKIAAEFQNGIVNYTNNKPRTMAYQIRVDVGQPDVRRWSDWSVNLAYRYVQRDAVLDAFTDSIFHLGGTNAKGWVAGVQYGLAKNTWLNLRWLSTDAIDGPKYSIDTLNVDLNARF
ncbi:putative porin [Methylomonas sp. 2BW1-5-20]|uniref:putative porin n=1 Tax=Methylomonas sp. 2BW1-5-20 TaxID=3376686 RepID=UPI00404F624A